MLAVSNIGLQIKNSLFKNKSIKNRSPSTRTIFLDTALSHKSRAFRRAIFNKRKNTKKMEINKRKKKKTWTHFRAKYLWKLTVYICCITNVYRVCAPPTNHPARQYSTNGSSQKKTFSVVTYMTRANDMQTHDSHHCQNKQQHSRANKPPHSESEMILVSHWWLYVGICVR